MFWNRSSSPFILSLVPWSSGPLVRWSLGPLVLWSLGPLVLWSSGSLVPWSLARLFFWSCGPLLLWSSLGSLVPWSFGSPATSLYPSAAAAFETCCPYLFALWGRRCALPRTPSRFFNPPRKLQVKPKETLKKRRPKRSLKSKETLKKRCPEPSLKKP